MNELGTRLSALFSPERILDHVLGQLLPNIIVAGLAMAAFYLLHRALDRAARIVLKRVSLDATASVFLLSILRYAVFTVGTMTALAQLGVDTASLLTSLGVAGLTIGFAARDALSNIISGLFIFWDRPFVVGDLVEIDGVYGTVDTITMRSTRVVTTDGRMLAIPNSKVVGSTVASYTNFPHLRLDIDVTVSVEEDLSRVRSTLLSLVSEDARFCDTPPARVVTTALNDYNVALQLQVWLKDERSHVAERCELRERCFEALRTAGVDMPFETLALVGEFDGAALSARDARTSSALPVSTPSS